MSGSGLITKRNRATLRKVLPTVQIEKLLFGQAKQIADKAEQVVQPADPEHSRAAGGGPVSHPLIEPGVLPAEGSIDLLRTLLSLLHLHREFLTNESNWI